MRTATALLVVTALAGLGAARSAAGPDPTGATSQPQPAPAPAEAPVLLTLSLARDQDGLAEHVRAASRPGAAAAPLSTVEVAARFGASPETRTAVVGFFAAEGLEARIDATGMFATVPTDVGTAERLFGVELRSGPEAEGGGPTLLATTEPVVPAPLAGHVVGVIGLDTTARVRRLGAAVTGGATPTNTGTPAGCPEAVASGAMTPNQIRTAYGIDPLTAAGLDGAGGRVAVVDVNGFLLDDYLGANACFGRDTVLPTVQLVAPRTTPAAPGLETTLDLQVVAAIAPGIERLDVFEGGPALADLPALFAAPLDPGRYPDGELPDVLSASIGGCEESFGRTTGDLMEAVLLTAAAVGVTVVVAAGDHGSSACYEEQDPQTWTVRAVTYPASSAWATGVGGTNTTLAADNTIRNEVVWNDAPLDASLAAWAGGGGTSRVFPIPEYQAAAGVAGDARGVPDVAFFADLLPGYAILCNAHGCGSGGWQAVGGTSAAAPLLGAALTRIVQRRAELGLPRLGVLNPTLYAAIGDVPGLVRDVVEGTNDLFGVGCCTATPGYDLASGWGSLRFDLLLPRLAPVTPRFTG